MSQQTMLPYGRQSIEDDDIEAVIAILRSDWLTTGPTIGRFEQALAAFIGVEHAVAISNGTSALHAAMYAIGVGPGDEVIVPAMTFAASANAAVYQGATPIFADVDPQTLLIDPASVEVRLTAHTRAIVAVDYAGQPCDYAALRQICDAHRLTLIADSCHAIGGSYQGQRVGAIADLSTFSFHPVKHITTGEGGAITTRNAEWATKMRYFRNHGITTDHRQRAEKGSFFYEMVDLGYNYRMTDIQAALGISQLQKLPGWIVRRQAIAAAYDHAFAALPAVEPLRVAVDVEHAYHLYVVQFALDQLAVDRAAIFTALREAGLGVQVHYIPVHYHPYYRKRFGYGPGLCPKAEAAYERIVSLPIFPAMDDADIQRVIDTVGTIVNQHRA
jgi:perosamine synthetase